MTTTIQKLETIETTLTILLARLNEPYRTDVRTCIELLRQAKGEIKQETKS